ncbi:MAG: type IV pilus assembly protein PilM [Candidatus Hydrogenedentes bacterium]|nr:type IV pilus assembly protein PilM [Candidatus Hydrogenedentota bacterium]
MAKVKRSRSKRLVLDVGNSAVRLCELSSTKTGYQLTKYYHREFPIEPAMDEEKQREVRRDVVRNLLKDAKVRHKKTIFGVPGQSVFTRTRALPPVPEYKVTQIVKYEIQQQIPFSLDQIAFDYQVLQRTEAGGYEVLMAAIKVDVVEKRLEVIRDVKRLVDTVDVCPLSAYNWLKYTGEFGDQGDCVALIDLGAATTDIVIERENQFRFTRSLNIGGNDITSAIAAEFGIGWAEAEKMKRERGFAPSGDAQRDGKGGEIIGRVLNRLISEVSRSFAYFRSQPGGGPVSRIIVTGGGACLRNIIPFLQRQLGIEVRIAQPLAGLAIAPGAQEVNEHPEQAAVVLGLALRTCERVTIGVNLIPPRIREAAKHKDQAVYWALSILTLGLIIASIIPVMAQRNKMVQDQIELEKSAIAKYDPRLTRMSGSPSTWKSPYETELTDTITKISKFKDEVTKLDEALTKRQFWMDHLVNINDARPRGQFLLLWSVETTTLGPNVAATTASRPMMTSEEEEEDTYYTPAGGGFGPMAPPPLKYSSTGFRGIEPLGGRMSSGSAGMPGSIGGMGSASARRTGAATTASMRTPAQGATSDVGGPGEYNAITIQGFAGSIDTILLYVENLKNSKKYVEGGVFYDERFTDPIMATALDNAWSYSPQARGGIPGVGMGGGGMMGGGGQGNRNRRDDDDDYNNSGGMSMSMGGDGGGSYPGNRANTISLWNEPSAMYPFKIDLQFSGERADEMKATPEQVRGSRTSSSGDDDGRDDRGRRRR